MKIGLVLDDSLDKADGVQQYILTLGQWLGRQGHEVHYLVGHTKRQDIPRVHSLSRNLQVHFNQNRMTTPLPASGRAIRELLKREEFDVLHVQLPYSPFLSGKIIRYAPKDTALIGTFHIIPYSRTEAAATRLLGLALRRTRKKFDAVVSVSEPAALFAKKSFRLRTTVVPNAVNISRFHAGKKLKKYRDDRLTMVYLGRLVERKGCLHFLQALEELHRQNLLHNVRVLICGKGPLENRLKSFVAGHHLGKIVHFIGFVPEAEKPDYYASADVVVLPSTGGESFGIVLVEAMAATPGVVVAGNNVGYRSVMGERPDQLVDPRDTKAFAQRLKHFLLSSQARNRAKKWQQAKAHTYDVQIVGDQLVHIYRQALRNKSGVR